MTNRNDPNTLPLSTSPRLWRAFAIGSATSVAIAFLAVCALVFGASCATVPAPAIGDSGRVYVDEDGAEWSDAVLLEETINGSRAVSLEARGFAGEGVVVIAARGGLWSSSDDCRKISIGSADGEIPIASAFSYGRNEHGVESIGIAFGLLGLAAMSESKAIEIQLCDGATRIRFSPLQVSKAREWAGRAMSEAPRPSYFMKAPESPAAKPREARAESVDVTNANKDAGHVRDVAVSVLGGLL